MKATPTYKLFITYNTGIELDLYSLRVIGRTRTNKLVGWVGYKGVTTCISNRCRENSFILRRWEMLQEDMLDTPETARSKNGKLRLSLG